MPEETTTIVESAPPTAPPAPTEELHVTTATVTDHGPAAPPPKKGSARESMFSDLRKKAGVMEDVEPAKPAETPKPKVESKPPKPAAEKPAAEAAKPAEEAKAEAPAAPAAELTPEEKKKISPWKLVDQYKGKVAELEKQVLDAKSSGLAEAERKKLSEQLTALQKEREEMVNDLRYHNAEKYDPEIQKINKRYEDSWKKWIADLSEITVTVGEGQERPLRPEDILELVNMTTAKARRMAQEYCGDYAEDVMAARNEIRGIFDEKKRALDDIRENGGKREEERMTKMREAQESLHKTVSELWNQTNDEITKDEQYGSYFRPTEGDEEGNARLQKGYELADKAFAHNPLDPRLTTEQRAEAIRLQSALRHRAAAFGRLTHLNISLQAEVKALKDELAKFKNAEPGAGEGTTSPSAKPATPASARDQVFGALRKMAHEV